MKKISDDKYIQLLKFGRDNLDGIKSSELQEKLKSLSLPSEYDGMSGTLNYFCRDAFIRDGDKFRLTFAAYFQLMEHERLEEARIESKKSTKIAIASMMIGIIFLIVSSIIGLIQLSKSY